MVTYEIFTTTKAMCDIPGSCVTNRTSTPSYHDTRETLELDFRIMVAVCIIAIVGIILNVLNLIVLIRLARIRNEISPIYHLLLATTLADIMALFFWSFYLLGTATRHPPLRVTEESPLFHQILVDMWHFPLDICDTVSNWLLIASALFRILAVTLPGWYTLRSARVIIILIFAATVAINIPAWSAVNLFVDEDGKVKIFSYHFSLSWSWIHTYYKFKKILDIDLPCFTAGILIVALSCDHPRKAYNPMTRQKEYRKIGITIIALLVWILLCSAPLLTYHIMTYKFNQDLDIQLFSKLLQFGYTLKLGGKIVSYCLCSSTYRKMLVNTLLCRKEHKEPEGSPSTLVQPEEVAMLSENMRNQLQSDRPSETRPFTGTNGGYGMRFKSVDETAEETV